jgi:hypothetical protein
LRPVHLGDMRRTRAEVVDAFRHLHPRRIEHGWARRPDLGYRYDHAHSSAQLLPLLQTVRLATTATTPLLVFHVAAAATSENELEPTLF